MGGATGNKGSVAFRIVVFSTSICFICSHFAAGQNEIRDRNEDFATTLKKIRFPLGREIDSHDVIFWLGDFNYRINLSGDEVKNAVRNGDYAKLVENDQLTQQKALGQTFVGFNEGQLTFAPTYKYDTFSDDYDTSEKCRAPAWTDRILWKDQRKKGKTQLLSYDRSELKTSDHRPVGAVFKVETFKVGGRKCVELIEDVVESMGPPDGTIIVSIAGKPRFPPQMFPPIHEKLKELGAQVQLSKFDDGDLWIVLNSGEMALAALSMDGLKIGGTDQINVKLKSPDWAYALKPHLSDFDLESFEVTAEEEALLGGTDGAVFEFADEDEDAISVSSLTLTGSAPDRPRPPSARSEAISVAKLEWPTEQPNVLSTSMPTRASSASLANSSWYEHVPPLAPPQSNNNKSPPQACLFNPFTQSAPSPAPPPSTIPLPPTRGASVGPGPPAVPVRKAPPPPPRPVIPPRPKNM